MASSQMHCRGIARNIHWHDSPTRSKVLSFRIEELDDSGNVARYVPVELSQLDVVDIIVDSDEVEVTGRMQKNGILAPELVRNVRTGAIIDASRPGGRMKYLIAFSLPFVFGLAGFLLSLGSRHAPGMSGLVDGFIAGGFICIAAWVAMAIIDSRRSR